MAAPTYPAMTEPCYICPRDKHALSSDGETLCCAHCGHRYPIVRGIPILIDTDTSVFSVEEIISSSTRENGGSGYWHKKGTRVLYRRMVGKVQNHVVHISSLTIRDAVNFVLKEKPDARILVVGAANNDLGHDGIIYSDVRLGKNVSVIFDMHAIPYPDGYFDAVFAIAVLEHVFNPWHCAQEITRVVAEGGYVYSSVPFLQPVHMGAYDFTRFTYLGHRRLFRSFEEVTSGAEMGPATSTAFAFQGLLLSFSDRPSVRKFLRLAGILGAAPIKLIDRLIRHRSATLDGAASTFFFGRKTAHVISDQELLTLYRGAQ